METIGLYGGTFAPPHLGHVHAVDSFLRQITVDKLYIMPVYQSPHKSRMKEDTPALRLEMCRAAFADIPRVEVSDYEIQKADVSYTVDTLRYFSTENRRIYLLCGDDMFMTLDNWREFRVIFSLAEIVCMSRTSDNDEDIRKKAEFYQESYGKKCILLDDAPRIVSSTEIREAIKQGCDLSALVPASVETILRRENLYKGNDT